MRYVLLMLLIFNNIESSEGWFNNSFCMTNQTSGMPLATGTSDNFSALDTTIGALALWWIPLGCNILRWQLNKRKIAQKIGKDKQCSLRHRVLYSSMICL